MSTRLILVYCLLAGACDAVTGVLLVSVPLSTLELMRIAEPPPEPIYLRFIGAFVGAVGLAYLLPLRHPARSAGRAAALAAVLEVTALVRLSVALFLGVSIAAAALAPAWSSVFLTDLALAVAQILMLRRLPWKD